MKQGIQIRLGQQITMTPQLQQAIRLLQLSTFELQAEIQQILESNIMLEMVEDEDEVEETQELDFGKEEKEEEKEEWGDSNGDLLNSDNEGNQEVATLTDDIPKELAIDSEWEDIYDTGTSFNSPDSFNSNDKDFLTHQESAPETLQDYLRWQLDLTPFNDLDRAIAMTIIDAIDNDGYLRVSLEEIAESLDVRLLPREIEAVLRRIQHFDPIGVGARDLSECLLLQLGEQEPNTPWLKEAQHLVKKYLDILSIHDYIQLSKYMKLDRENLRKVINLIQSLNPRPGARLEASQTTYVIPDVFVKKDKNQWKVELNSEISPKLRINSHYVSLIPRIESRDDHNNLKNHLQEARWFIKSLKSRQDTLLRVAKSIVKRQAAFLEYGEEAMRPLILHDIASELEMHESTISRVTSQKYLHTPRGIFELKYFFSSHVNTESGSGCSSTAIRAMIKKLIASESAEKPLSDSKIAVLLSERGIKVARRTVAKYREAMVIPPSNERKRLA